MTPKYRYQTAHERDFKLKYPQAYASGNYFLPTMPDVRKANGLTQAIVKFLMWNGHRATRINSAGRIIKQPQRQASGVSLMTAKYIPGATRKGAADISATIQGRSVMLEIKIGKDKPSEYQLREQALERAAGGVYEFIHSMEEFFLWYDGFMVTLSYNPLM
jgi:hypothetical protein